MNGIFVTGTDTGIGKTVLSALLVAALDAVYWKPVQTGAVEGTDRETVRRLAAAQAYQLPPESYCFDPPVSPHLAARMAGTSIALESLQFPSVAPQKAWVVEGAGGVMAPINASELMLDLMAHLALPVVVAARCGLGTINHTLLTLAALRHAKLPLCGVVMIGEHNAENRKAIEHYGKIAVIGHIPVLQRIDRGALLGVYDQHFDQQVFQRAING